MYWQKANEQWPIDDGRAWNPTTTGCSHRVSEQSQNFLQRYESQDIVSLGLHCSSTFHTHSTLNPHSWRPRYRESRFTLFIHIPHSFHTQSTLMKAKISWVEVHTVHPHSTLIPHSIHTHEGQDIVSRGSHCSSTFHTHSTLNPHSWRPRYRDSRFTLFIHIPHSFHTHSTLMKAKISWVEVHTVHPHSTLIPHSFHTHSTLMKAKISWVEVHTVHLHSTLIPHSIHTHEGQDIVSRGSHCSSTFHTHESLNIIICLNTTFDRGPTNISCQIKTTELYHYKNHLYIY